MALAYGANVALGVALLGLAALVARRSPDRATRATLALFLALVGANYFAEGWSRSGLLDETPRHVLVAASSLANLFDPPALVAFAFAVTGRRLGARGLAAAWAGPALVATGFVLARPGYLGESPILPLYTLEIFAYYPLALVVLVRGYLREPRSVQRDRLGTLVVALSAVTLPRPLLAYLDLGLHRSLPFRWWAPALAAILVALSFALAQALVRGAAPIARDHARRTARASQGVLFVVAGVWALTALPAVGGAAFAIVFSARWFLFVAVFAIGVRRYELLDLSDAAERRVRLIFLAATVTLGVLEVAVVLGGLPDADAGSTILVGCALAGLGFALAVALREAAPEPSRELSWRALSAYRAHVELGTPEPQLDALRARLGLTERAARQVRDLVAIERAAPSRVADELREGATFAGRYAIERFLGAGSFGRAFLAMDEVERERVVLKELSPAWRNDAEAVHRFRREAEVALLVRHPRLVAFRGLERAGDGHVLVLQYVEGETLRARLARGPLSPAQARVVGEDVAAALDALHEIGIVHRDVKPENIVLDGAGRATLLDFGSAAVPAGGTRLAGGETVRLDVSDRAHPGTRAYMAPEQVRGAAVSPATDVYALAATLAEALGPAPPDAWRAVLARALAADPRARVATAAEFAAALPQASYGADGVGGPALDAGTPAREGPRSSRP